MPYFSIIIPLYNKEKHIKNTLMSALSQSFEDFEVIVINDGSTDGSLAEVNSIKDGRVKIFTIENQGVSYARNYGISKANSNLIAFLDADDFWRPFHLQNLKAVYEKFPNCGLYAAAYSSSINGKELPSIYKNIPKDGEWMGIVNDYFLSSSINCIAWTSAVMVPKSSLEVVGNFDETITLGAGEDIDLWMRIALRFPVAFCNKVSAVYELQADNRISKSNPNLRTFLNLDAYEALAKTNKSLKTYVDINRYSIAIQYMLVGNDSKAKDYIDSIDMNNLNAKQRFLIQMNTPILKGLVRMNYFLRRNGIRLSTFS